jgi:hypothetical protein
LFRLRARSSVVALNLLSAKISELRQRVTNPHRLRWILAIRRVMAQNAVKKYTEQLHAYEYQRELLQATAAQANQNREKVAADKIKDADFGAIMLLTLNLQRKFNISEYSRLKALMVTMSDVPEFPFVDIAISQRPNNRKLRKLRHARQTAAARKIQGCYKRYRAAFFRHEASDVQLMKRKIALFRESMSTKIQMQWRRYWLPRVRRAKIKLQTYFRMLLASIKYRRSRAAIHVIQSLFRHCLRKKRRKQFGHNNAYGFDFVEVIELLI